jgi:hypothetical protein
MTIPWTRHRPVWGVAAALLSAAACDGPTPPQLADCGQLFGSFEGRVSGAASDTLDGCGYYAFSTVDGGFGMVLTNGGPSGDPMVKVFGPSLFGTRTVGTEVTGVVFIGPRTFTLTSGTITAVSRAGLWERKTLVGSLDVTGTETGGATVRVTGQFDSGCVGIHEEPSQVGDTPRSPPPECAVRAAGARAP